MSDFTFRGKPARVLIELQYREGTMLVDVTPHSIMELADPYGNIDVLRVALRRPLQAQLYEADKKATFEGWRDV